MYLNTSLRTEQGTVNELKINWDGTGMEDESISNFKGIGTCKYLRRIWKSACMFHVLSHFILYLQYLVVGGIIMHFNGYT